MVFESGADWSTRHQSVTIDATATAYDLKFYHYGADNGAFQHINILTCAKFFLNDEYIDQASSGELGTYTQSGVSHTVNGDFRYTTKSGSFSMTGGVFEVGGTLNANPDVGSFSVSGGTLTANRLSICSGFEGNHYSFGGNADIHIIDEFDIGDKYTQSLSFSCPIRMDGADFVNRHQYSDFDVLGIEDLQLIFEGGLSDISSFEVAGIDYGVVSTGLIDNYAIDILQVGDIEQGYVSLVNLENNNINYSGDEAVYVNKLIIYDGCILDLNGYNLYCNELIDYGGTFLNGAPIVVPEPATILILGLGTLAVLRKRRV